MAARSSPKLPSYLWHHRVHTEKAGESLYFWRLGFGEVYERDRAEAAIRAVCERHGVGGLIAYELLGIYDLLLRIWLPAGCGFDSMHSALTEELTSAGLTIIDPFRVHYMIRHWPFCHDGHQEAPTDGSLHNLSPEAIERVEEDLAAVPAAELAEMREHLLLAAGDRDDGGFTSNGDRGEEPLGIKFAISISAKDGLGRRGLVGLEERVTRILDEARSINQRSLYAGSGFGHLLILGRTGYGPDSFHALQGELIGRLNAADLREPYGTRTVSHLCAQRGYSLVSERLSGIGGRELVPPSPPPISSGERLRPGSDFAGRFEIRWHLGGGGFADVYRAYDRFEEVDRALKVFRSPDPRQARREIEALAKVDHPNVAKLKFGESRGPQWFIVCEFIDGVPLSEIGSISRERAMTIVIEILGALVALHPDDERIAELESLAAEGEVSMEVYSELESLRSEGLIHRDVKPENIMLGKDGRAYLVDFNIASPARVESHTHSGTPEFLAPDAGLGYWDPADDLFSCGVVLYKLLTGHHPFPEARPVAGIRPIDPQSFVPDLPYSLAELLIRACEPLRRDRYQTAREMRRDLEAELLAMRRGAGAAEALVELRSSRTRFGISLTQIAAASGLEEGRIARLESGETEARPSELLELSLAVMRTVTVKRLIEDYPDD
jgi:tRNA A-37 threonylcarbamoyl transferase component Bud32